jgi:hypothetical protein
LEGKVRDAEGAVGREESERAYTEREVQTLTKILGEISRKKEELSTELGEGEKKLELEGEKLKFYEQQIED